MAHDYSFFGSTADCVIKKEHVVLLFILDETEAILTPATRDVMARYELSNMILEVLGNAYSISNGGYPNIIVIVTSIYGPEGWPNTILKLLARQPRNQHLVNIVQELELLTPEEYRHIADTSEEERWRYIDRVIKYVQQRFPLAKPEVKQRIYNIRLHYTANDYIEFIEGRLKLSLMSIIKPMLAKFLEAIQLSFRTLVNLAHRAHTLGITEVSLSSFGKLLTLDGIKSSEYQTTTSNLISQRILPKHTKWTRRVLDLVEEGAIIIADRERLNMLRTDEWKVYRDIYLRLYKRFYGKDIRYLRDDVVVDVINVIHNQLYLQYKVVTYINGFYVLDEYLVRWFLDDPVDILGQHLSLDEFIASHHKQGRKVTSYVRGRST